MTVLETEFYGEYDSLGHFIREEEMEEEMEEHYGTNAPDSLREEGTTGHGAISSLIQEYWDGDYVVYQEEILLSTLVYKVKYPSEKKFPEALGEISFMDSNKADIVAQRDSEAEGKHDAFCYVWNLKNLGDALYMIQYIPEDDIKLVGYLKEGTIEAEKERLEKDGFEIVKGGEEDE